MRSRAARYARAAASAAGEAPLAPLAESLGALAEAMNAVPDLREAAFNPSFRRQQPAVLEAVLATLGGSTVAKRLVALMAKNSRLDEVGEVALQIEAQADRQAQRLRARIESAVPLTSQQATRIAQALGRRVAAQVELTTIVRPELIGGWVCHIGAITLDASLRRALDNLADRLLSGAGPHPSVA